jgi:hypothetical protein
MGPSAANVSPGVRFPFSTHTRGLVPWRALVRVEQAFLPTVAPWLGGSPFNALVSAVRPSSQRTVMGKSEFRGSC